MFMLKVWLNEKVQIDCRSILNVKTAILQVKFPGIDHQSVYLFHPVGIKIKLPLMAFFSLRK